MNLKSINKKVIILLLLASVLLLVNGASAEISAGISRFVVSYNGMAVGNGEPVQVILLFDRNTMRQYLIVPRAGIIEIENVEEAK